MLGSLLERLEPALSDDEGGDTVAADVNFHILQTDGDTSPAECNALVVCCHGAAAALAKSGFSLAPAPWLLSPQNSSSWDSQTNYPPLPVATRIYTASSGAAKGKVAVAVLAETLPAEFAVAWSSALLQAFGNVEEVLVLSHMLRSEWRVTPGSERPDEPFLCGLWTPSDVVAALPPLPPPNHVEGLPAAILSECTASKRQCVVALTVQDGAHLGETCLQAFERIRPTLVRLGLVDSGQRISYRDILASARPPHSMSIYA
mmetsp:Transcript_51403/g.95048  ORF Transcript_51403/g.95048 Transcript_51403/m.95048 type:complete len:260 (-) Transcript_51403:28-807(-)